jgi:hypothetical protein
MIIFTFDYGNRLRCFEDFKCYLVTTSLICEELYSANNFITITKQQEMIIL